MAAPDLGLNLADGTATITQVDPTVAHPAADGSGTDVGSVRRTSLAGTSIPWNVD